MTVLVAVLSVGCLEFPDGMEGSSDASVTIDASVADAPVEDANCTDSDGDGYLPAGCGSALPVDCAPNDPDQNPGTREVCGDSMDQNCDSVDTLAAACVTPNVIESTSGYRITNGNIEVRFNPARGTLITELRLRPPNTTTNLLRETGTMNEMFIGVNLWEQAFQHNPDTPPEVTVLASGPAVFRVRIHSEAGGSAGIDVVSHYTVFPDGRIHKDDEVTLDEIQTETRWLTSYVALEPAEFTHVSCGYDANQVAVSAGGGRLCTGSSSDLVGHACAYSNTTGAMVGFIHSAPNSPVPDGPRIEETGTSPSDDHNVSLIFDWHAGEPIPSGTRNGDFVVFAGRAGAAASECSAVAELSGWVLSPAQVNLDLAQGTLHTGTSANSDDNSDGYYEGAGFWAINAANANDVSWTINDAAGTLQPPERPAFRIHGLALTRGVDLYYLPYVEVDGAPQVHGEDYLWQVSNDPGNAALRVGWLFFNRQLAHDSTVRVRVPDGSL